MFIRDWKLTPLDNIHDQENDTASLDVNDLDPVVEQFYEFTLPKDAFGEMAFARRLAPEGSQSPPTLPTAMASGRSSRNQRHSTIDDTDGTCKMAQS